MEIGKVPFSVLEKIVFEPIKQQKNKRPEILIRPEIGEDCSAIRFGAEEICVVSSDPITGAAADIGYLAVHVGCNDIASSGAEPIGIMVTILLPPEAEEEDLQSIMEGIYRAAEEIHIEVMGGHTEVTDAVVRPVVSTTAFGKAKQNGFISSGGAKVFQDVIMTKWAGLEGTAILAKDYGEKLGRYFAEEIIQKAQRMGESLSVVKEGEIAAAFGATAMHDATEGGILGAVWEVAACSGTGVELYMDCIPIQEETKALCSLFQIDPYGLISSGCMIITAFEGEKLVELLRQANIEAAIIGRITEQERVYIKDGIAYPLAQPKSDELYNIRMIE